MMLFDSIISQLIVKGLSKTHQDFISINEFFSKITPSLFTIKEAFFRKPTSPPLPLREGPPLISVFSPSGEKRKPPYSVLKPLRYKVGGPSEVSPAAELRFAVCDRMDQNRLRAAWCLLEAFSKTHLDFLNIKEVFFRKPTSPPLPLREGPPLISVFSPSGEKRKPLLLVARNHFILWLADHQRSRQQRSCGFLCGDKPAFTQGFA